MNTYLLTTRVHYTETFISTVVTPILAIDKIAAETHAAEIIAALSKSVSSPMTSSIRKSRKR